MVPLFHHAVRVVYSLVYIFAINIHHSFLLRCKILSLPLNIKMAAHDGYESDKEIPLESGRSDSSSTLLPRADPWNYHSRKSSRSLRERQICSYRNWLIGLNALLFLTSIGLWAVGILATKSQECYCDVESWTTKFEEDCKDPTLFFLENNGWRDKNWLINLFLHRSAIYEPGYFPTSFLFRRTAVKQDR